MVNRILLDLVYTALSDPTRREVLQRLSSGPQSISDLAAPYAMTLPAFLKHLKVLEQADLVTREKRGRTTLMHLNRKPLSDAAAWLTDIQEKT